MRRSQAFGLLGALGFVGTVLGVAVLSERKQRKNGAVKSCVADELLAEEWLSRLSEAYGTEKPKFTMRGEAQCGPSYEACITYGSDTLHFKCGKVTPGIVAHEFSHWFFKRKGSVYYADEPTVEAFAQLSLRLLSKGERRKAKEPLMRSYRLRVP